MIKIKFTRVPGPARCAGDCWLAAYKTRPSGHVYLNRNGKQRPAHRIQWINVYGPIPDDLCVLHWCDRPSCVNPEHLYLGTKQDNMHDYAERGTRRKQTHCKRGHELTEGNELWSWDDTRGAWGRTCLLCTRERRARRTERERLARLRDA